MSEYSGFFDALRDADGNFDRTYRSGDYCDNLAVIISNGVLRSDADDLKPTAAGMSTKINAGRAWIKGHWYYNDNTYQFDAVTAPTGNSRYDRIFLRLDLSITGREIGLVYVQGTPAASPTKPAPTRNESVYDLCICDILVNPNATSVTVTDTRADNTLCGWVYSTSGDGSFFTTLDNQFDVWFSGVRDTLATSTVEIEYKQYTVLTAASKTAQITIPQYDSTVNQKIAVYVNGVRDVAGTDYTININTITFANTLIAGTKIAIYITIAKDGSGIPSLVDDVTALQNKVAALEAGVNSDTYNYICNNSNDNVAISNIVKTYLNGGTDYGTLTVRIYGTLGITAAVSGDGTSVNPYIYFNAGLDTAKNRRVILDFCGCSQITVPIADNSNNVIFDGIEANIKNCGIIANNTTATTTIFSPTANAVISAENCRFWITASAGYIAQSGSFRRCRVSLTIYSGNAYCFTPQSASLLRLFEGEYYAYALTGNVSAIVYVPASSSEAVVNTYSLNCPTIARSGFVQSYAIYCLSNNATCSFTDTITTLEISAAGQNIRGTIIKNKVGMM